MQNEEHINRKTEKAINSLDKVERAACKPFLLTRINARMNRQDETGWEKAVRWIGRPSVAFTGLCMVLLINVLVIMLNRPAPAETVTEQVVQAPVDEFSYTVATIYDFENIQP